MTRTGVRLTLVFATALSAPAARAHGERLVAGCGLPASRVELLPYPANRRGLCAVYNDALRRAAGEYVVLVHDDVSFERAPAWAARLIRVLETHPEFSILGVAGASILQENGFWLNAQVSCGHVYHRIDGRLELTRFSAPHARPLPVAALDGLFLLARTRDVRDLALDEETFDGFHFYDMELSMQARARGLRLGVTDEVDLVHESPGGFGPDWEAYRLGFVARYAGHLPASALQRGDLFHFRAFTSAIRAPRSVAILIPVGDRADRLRNAVAAIHNRTAPGIPYQIYLLDTGSSGAFGAELRSLPGVRLLEPGSGRFSAMHNEVILERGLVGEDLLLFHDSHVELVNDALAHLLGAWESTDQAGVVGARLHSGNGLLQHAGLRVSVRGSETAVEPHRGHLTLWNYPSETLRGVAGGTLALALVERDLYCRLGGLDERYGSRAAEVDFNLRAILAGRTNLLAGDAVAILGQEAAPCPDREHDALARFIEQNLAGLRGCLDRLPAEEGAA